MITAAQSRAARALLNWSQSDLAKAAGCSLSTIRDFETSKRDPMMNNRLAIQNALEKAGVIFITPTPEHGAGVCFRKILKFNHQT